MNAAINMSWSSDLTAVNENLLPKHAYSLTQMVSDGYLTLAVRLMIPAY